jgi:uncharacterized membrane protein (DUF106 family)
MAFGIDDAIAAGLKIIDKFIPDPELKAKMAQELENNKKDMLLANLEADNKEAEELTKRWQADLASDSWLAKNIRPMTLIFILVAYFFFAFMSMFDYETKSAYVELLGQWGMLVMTAYFGGRSLEKIMEMKSKTKIVETEDAK